VTDYLISETTVAAETGVSRNTLRTWRAAGIGPEWIRIGPRLVRYRRSAVDQWIAQRETATRQTTTP
jgi:predicted DNA-binding transcriptional regulator AlpA